MKAMSKIANTPAEPTANLSKNALVTLWCIDAFYMAYLFLELANYGIDKQDASEVITDLKQAGLVDTYSYPCFVDYSVTLTDAGEAIARKYSECDIDALLAGGAK
jgi:hypothetical protein